MMVMTTASMQVIAATNRADILDPALMRSGRLDRKVEFPHPNEDARSKILQIHSRKMNVAPDVNFDELARSTDDFNAAQLKVRASTVCHGQRFLCSSSALTRCNGNRFKPVLLTAGGVRGSRHACTAAGCVGGQPRRLQ